MRMIYHDAGTAHMAAPPKGGKMQRLLETAGHELLPLEEFDAAGGPADCVIEAFSGSRKSQGRGSQGRGPGESPREVLSWARAQGLPTIALEPDLNAVHAGPPDVLKAHLGLASRVVTFEPRAYGPLEDLLFDSGALHCFLPFLDIGPYSAAVREAAVHRQILAGRLLCPADVPWLLTAGEMTAGDGLDSYRQLSQALSKILHDPWVLLVIGEGAAQREAESLLNHLPRDRLRMLGAHSGLHRPSIFAASDLFVWPAIGRACGPQLLEAQAAGLPVIAEKNTVVPNYVADGLTGKLSVPGSFPSLANQVSFLLRHANFRQTYRQEALKSTPEYFGLLRAAKDFNRILHGLVGKE